MSPARRAGHPDPMAQWSAATLIRPTRLLLHLGVLAMVTVLAQIASCNVHEFGHALVGSIVGWEVERVDLCLPGGGGVEYSSIPRWAGNIQGYAGGVMAAAFLLAVHVLVIARRGRPLRNPFWWAAGLGVVLPIGPQLVLALMEGSRRPGQDYTELFQDHPLIYVPLIAASAAVVGGLYVWRWRAVLRRPLRLVDAAAPPRSSLRRGQSRRAGGESGGGVP